VTSCRSGAHAFCSASCSVVAGRGHGGLSATLNPRNHRLTGELCPASCWGPAARDDGQGAFFDRFRSASYRQDRAPAGPMMADLTRLRPGREPQPDHGIIMGIARPAAVPGVITVCSWPWSPGGHLLAFFMYIGRSRRVHSPCSRCRSWSCSHYVRIQRVCPRRFPSGLAQDPGWLNPVSHVRHYMPCVIC